LRLISNFDASINLRSDRRLSEFALCELLGAVIEPSTGFDAGACFLPAASASAASASATAAPSIWDRHNLTSPSLVYPDSKLAPVPVELLAYLWPYAIYASFFLVVGVA
jgi:hypothetical protein